MNVLYCEGQGPHLVFSKYQLLSVQYFNPRMAWRGPTFFHVLCSSTHCQPALSWEGTYRYQHVAVTNAHASHPWEEWALPLCASELSYVALCGTLNFKESGPVSFRPEINDSWSLCHCCFDSFLPGGPGCPAPLSQASCCFLSTPWTNAGVGKLWSTGCISP